MLDMILGRWSATMIGVAGRDAEYKEQMLTPASEVLAGRAHSGWPARDPMLLEMG